MKIAISSRGIECTRELSKQEKENERNKEMAAHKKVWDMDAVSKAASKQVNALLALILVAVFNSFGLAFN